MVNLVNIVGVRQLMEYGKKVNWLLFVFICVFTMGSWIDISGIWCELPLIVEELPERWRLPSILTLISQIGQIAPLIFIIGRRFFPNKFTNANAILIVLTVGALSCFFMAIFWKKTAFIFNEERSIYLYLSSLSLSLLDSLSTITFLPYVGEFFAKEYIIPNYIGESLSSLIPGILAIIQGVGSPDECVNVTSVDNSTITITGVQTKFSVSVYFVLMGILICLSVASFTLINFLPYFKNMRKNRQDGYENSLEKDKSTLNRHDNNTIRIMLFISFLGGFINYGWLPGLMSYSTIPYGGDFMYLAVNLTSCGLTIAVLLSIFSYEVSTKRIILETLIPICLSTYILIMSIFSPCPPFVNAKYRLGGYFMVFCWVMTSCTFIRIRCLIATKLEKYGKQKLLLLGIFAIIGQLSGGLLIYFLVDVFRLFQDKPKCSPEDYCMRL
ncbi:unnamed protein product [Brachionus calyciflorus]|uniref:Riboflavin transporter n=1 Tax=Brachionus calyciflorus TaxID=104777 RepID=A0A813XKE8_9BILA|nr:unnamed protein product [Brachionus calyciflorus]